MNEALRIGCCIWLCMLFSGCTLVVSSRTECDEDHPFCPAGYGCRNGECVLTETDGDADADGDADGDGDGDGCDHPLVVESCPDGWCVIPAGCFTMGSPEDEVGGTYDEMQHDVTLTGDFEIQTTEVTQSQFDEVMGYNPSDFSSCGNDCPVEDVSWHEAAAYCNALSDERFLH